MALLLLVPAAGSGLRLGAAGPKALVPLSGRPMLARTLEALAAVDFDRAVVAAPADRLGEFAALCRGRADVVAGGASRAASVRAALEALAATDGDHVCIHDAARPLVAASDLRAVLAAAREAGAAIAAMPIADTVKKVDGFRISGTLDRATLWAAATPQIFRADWLRAALENGAEATDEAALVEAAGYSVCVVPVSRLTFKITTPEDLALAQAWLERSR